MTKMKISLWLSLFLIIGGGWFLIKLKKNQQEKTDLETIQFDLPYHPEWETASLTDDQQENLKNIFSQPFTYLGKGARLISFLSEDGEYVLKFFKYRYHQPHWSIRFFPPIFPFENYRKRKMQKVSLDTVLNGYKVAYTYDPEGTGLIYIHLNIPSDNLPTVKLIDKYGTLHQIDLNHTRFVLQRRVQEFVEVLDQLLENHEVELAKQKLNQILDLYRSHYQKGLHDLGVGILYNNGFIENQPVHFDVSKMTFDEKIRDPQLQKEKMDRMIRKVDVWLLKHHPSYREEMRLAL